MKLKLYNRDEIFIIDLDSVIYFKAEDHYTSVYYGKDSKQLLPFGLSQLEKTINAPTECANHFLRVGRSHLLNLPKIVHASVMKETVTMMTSSCIFVTIHISRSVIRELTRSLKEEDNCGVVANLAGGGNFPIIQSPALNTYLAGTASSFRALRQLAHSAMWR